MSKQKPKDNSTELHKVALRNKALDALEALGVNAPVVLEAYGGNGVMFDRCYSHLGEGVVLEKDDAKVMRLAKQRPSWSVYKTRDSVLALGEGAGRHLEIDLLDVDPYGSCWETITAFFHSERPFKKSMYVVVNDGLRQKLASNSGWEVKVLEPMVLKYGNDLHPIYKEIALELLGLIVEEAGYTVSEYRAYYCGHSLTNLHFLAKLEQG